MLKPAFAALALFTGAACAQVSVQDAWVRATIAQQKTTGAFMKLSSAQGARIVSASSPAASMVEIHEMKMAEGGVMQMRAVETLELPAGQTVALAPGGFHVMLMGLKAPIKLGDTVSLSLVVEGADKKRQTVEIKAVARAAYLPAKP